MKVRAVDYVCYYVKDYDNSFKFYKDVLGLKATKVQSKGSYAEFDCGNVTLAIGVAEKMGIKMGKPTGNAAVALSVADVPAAIEELKAKGVTVSPTQEYPDSCSMATVTDPSGNTILLHQRKDGTWG